MVSGYPVPDGQSRSQFTSSSASTTLSLAAIGLHNEETVSHTFPHCAANAKITSVIVSNLYRSNYTIQAIKNIASVIREAQESENLELRSPMSQNKWRSSNITPFSIIEWYYFIQASRINRTPTFSVKDLPIFINKDKNSIIKIIEVMNLLTKVPIELDNLIQQ